ncbi:MAG: ATP-binding protein [Bacteroidales bacterium]|nr:ATP-binding protein [Bacteroidales bacterium]
MSKYEMSLDLNVLNHLGLNLYSNTPAVLSEVIANSWDADASQVSIHCNQEDDVITIIDNGRGMTIEDINRKFLCVGYQKRNNGEAITPKYRRPVMGRKGIGKLSLLSIADTIKIYSKKDGEQNAFCLSREDIEREITSKNHVYSPLEIEFKDFEHETGTKIVIRKFKKNINRTSEFLRTRLARRFCIIGKDFNINLDGEPISLKDRDFFGKVQFLWPIGNYDTSGLSSFPNITVQSQLPGDIKGLYHISGWIATAEKPSDLGENNKISIVSRGKLAQEDILASYGEGGVYASYIIGEIQADFLDSDDEKDISTSNRQQYIEDDERYQALKAHIFTLLKTIKNKWTDLRKEKATEKVLSSSPAIKAWYDSLRNNSKKYATKLFAAIETMHFDGNEEKKREFLRFGILAFERLKISEKLETLENEDLISNLLKFGEVFADLQEIEATLYWEIANERIKVIRALSQSCDANAKERVLQQYIFDNLWLLNPSWERATRGSERLEQSVATEFDAITSNLSKEEQDGRLDIRYRNTSGRHVIIELKRYVPTYKVNLYKLREQVDRYRDALHKCLTTIGKGDEPIDAICIIGKKVIPEEMTSERIKDILGKSVRILFYDQIIEDAFNSYSDYLDSEKEVSRIQNLIDNI